MWIRLIKCVFSKDSGFLQSDGKKITIDKLYISIYNDGIFNNDDNNYTYVKNIINNSIVHQLIIDVIDGPEMINNEKTHHVILPFINNNIMHLDVVYTISPFINYYNGNDGTRVDNNNTRNNIFINTLYAVSQFSHITTFRFIYENYFHIAQNNCCDYLVEMDNSFVEKYYDDCNNLAHTEYNIYHHDLKSDNKCIQIMKFDESNIIDNHNKLTNTLVDNYIPVYIKFNFSLELLCEIISSSSLEKFQYLIYDNPHHGHNGSGAKLYNLLTHDQQEIINVCRKRFKRTKKAIN